MEQTAGRVSSEVFLVPSPVGPFLPGRGLQVGQVSPGDEGLTRDPPRSTWISVGVSEAKSFRKWCVDLECPVGPTNPELLAKQPLSQRLRRPTDGSSEGLGREGGTRAFLPRSVGSDTSGHGSQWEVSSAKTCTLLPRVLGHWGAGLYFGSGGAGLFKGVLG